MVMRYPDSRNGRSIETGTAFELHVIDLLTRAGIVIRRCESLADQLAYGDARDDIGIGYEIKLDQRCEDTGRLSIEVAEKTALDRPWVDSGIFSSSNATYYIQGAPRRFWVFRRADLQQWYRVHQPMLIDDNPPTIKKFYIPVRPLPGDLAHIPVTEQRSQAIDTLRAIAGQKPTDRDARRYQRAIAFLQQERKSWQRWADLSYDYQDD